MTNKIQLFEEKKIRSHWDEGTEELSSNLGQLKIKSAYRKTLLLSKIMLKDEEIK